MGSLYSAHRTWMHAVPAAVKLILLGVLGTFLFLTQSSTTLFLSAGPCCAMFLSLGRACLAARKLIYSLVIAGLLVVALHTILGQAMLGVVSATRLLSAALLGISLTLTTRSNDLLHVFEQLLLPLQRLGIRTDRLALQLALMLRFTEHFFVQWRRLDDAHRVRTGKPGGVRILAPLTIQMLVSARRVADTLDVRLGD